MKNKAAALRNLTISALLLGTALGCSQPGPEPASSATSEAKGALQHALPPNNPSLIQNSVYPLVHFDVGATDTTTLPSWPGNSTL